MDLNMVYITSNFFLGGGGSFLNPKPSLKSDVIYGCTLMLFLSKPMDTVTQTFTLKMLMYITSITQSWINESLLTIIKYLDLFLEKIMPKLSHDESMLT